ncbi:MAG: quinoprotein relay system zinc metallohydrolase 2 [Hyphomicrobiaceae bacterium]
MDENHGHDGLTRQSVLRLTLAAALKAAAGGTGIVAASALAHAGGTGVPAADRATAPSDTNAPPIEVASGIFVHKGEHNVYTPANGGDICNTGFIIGDESVAVIDTGGAAKVGAALAAHIRAITDRPIRFVINTHMHPDHVLGNVSFKSENTVFLGHRKLAAALATRAERYLISSKTAIGEDKFAGTEIVLPTRGIEDSEEIDLGGRRLVLTARPTAHTDNDLTVHDPATGTLFTGDLIFSGHVPTLDGSIRGWLKLLDALQAVPQARIVPGHGPVSMAWPAAAEPIKAYLDTIAQGVRTAIKDGRTMQQAIDTVGLSERSKWLLFEEFHARNVSAAFAELEWE